MDRRELPRRDNILLCLFCDRKLLEEERLADRNPVPRIDFKLPERSVFLEDICDGFRKDLGAPEAELFNKPLCVVPKVSRESKELVPRFPRVEDWPIGTRGTR